jgi:hypothetical protein
LIYKLLKLEIGGNFLKIIENMYHEVSYCIKLNSHTTEQIPSNVGVKQGCVLSPTIFNLFLADLPDIFDTTCDPVQNFDSTLNCLMFADDIVLLAQSAEGLQNSLNKLKSYCETWQLTLNTDKTKIMIFNRGGHDIKRFKFHYGQTEILTTQKYCYLGIIFTPSGLFTEAVKSLYEKASKSFFLLRQLNIRENVKLTLKLFNSLVLPILHYGCEVWAPFMFKNLNENNYQSLCDSAYIEKLNIKLCKYILGVNKKSTNIAVKAELGQFPLTIKALDLAFKFWHRLAFLEPEVLVKKAYLDTLMTTHKNYNGWSKSLLNLLQSINLDEIWENQINGESFNVVPIKQNLENIYTKQWNTSLSKSSKLKTYYQIKNEFKLENYLLTLPLKTRRNLTKLRISAHLLASEFGRYSRPVTPPEKRLCQYCDLNCVENEYHFIMECPFYQFERENAFGKLDFIAIDWNDSNLVFNLLLSNMDSDICSVVSDFVNICFEKRNEYFVKENGHYTTKKDLQNQVEFSKLCHLYQTLQN